MAISRVTIVICALLASASASARPLTACDFISQRDVERELGEKVTAPKVVDMNICAGLCASINTSRCEFKTTGTSPLKRVYLEVSLPHFEFDGIQERRILESGRKSSEAGIYESVQSIPGFGPGAFWYYRSDIRQSLFFAYRRGQVRFMVQEIGLDAEPALAGAVAIVRAALKKWNSLPAKELKNAFQFQTAGQSHS